MLSVTTGGAVTRERPHQTTPAAHHKRGNQWRSVARLDSTRQNGPPMPQITTDFIPSEIDEPDRAE
jgi:hypothetical protein